MSTQARSRVAYFNVPFNERSLRVREPERKPAPEPKRQESPLDDLIVVPTLGPEVIVHADQDVALAANLPVGSEFLEPRWADDECPHDRLPGDPTPPCGCFPEEGEVEVVIDEQPDIDTDGLPEPQPEPVPDLIPEWVLADARDLAAQGMTVRKIARMILPATDCPDVPSCEQLLKLKLETEVS